MLKAEIGVHLLQAPVLVREFLQLPYVRDLHAAVLGFPVVVGRIGYPILAANLLHLATAFDLFQYANNLCFLESCFTHSAFSLSASLCRRTQIPRGAILREAYRPSNLRN